MNVLLPGRPRRSLAALATAAGLVGGLLGGTPAAAAPAGPAARPPVDLATGGVHAPVPMLAWTDCSAELGPGIQCATARVPLDYDHPAGPTADVALARDPADDPAARIGSPERFPAPGCSPWTGRRGRRAAERPSLRAAESPSR